MRNALDVYHEITDMEDRIDALAKAIDKLDEPSDFGSTWPSSTLAVIKQEYENQQQELFALLQNAEV